MDENERELFKLRIDYAWKWFDLHAKQRMTLFNYFLIIAGILANGMLLSIKDDPRPAIPATTISTTTVPTNNTLSAVATVPGAQPIVTQAISVPAATQPTLEIRQTYTGSATTVPDMPAMTHSHLIRIGIGVLGLLASVAFIVFDIRNRVLTALSEDVLEQLERDVLFPDGLLFMAGKSKQQLGMLRTERDLNMREGQRRTLSANILKMKWWIWGLEGLIGIGFLISIFL